MFDVEAVGWLAWIRPRSPEVVYTMIVFVCVCVGGYILGGCGVGAAMSGCSTRVWRDRGLQMCVRPVAALALTTCCCIKACATGDDVPSNIIRP
jgi:hypothetical protein